MSKVLPVEMLPAHAPTGVVPTPGILPPAPPPTPGMVGGGLGTIQDFNQNNQRTVLGQLGFLADVGRSVLEILGGTQPSYETWDTTKGPPAAPGTPRYQTLLRFGSMAPPFSGNLFHGTQHAFQEFEDVAQSAHSLYGPGHYFTENPAVASEYAIGKPPAERPMSEAERAAHFVPGKVVASRPWGDYRVLEYRPTTPDRKWSVTVEKVVQDPVSGQWVPDPGHPQPEVHSISPTIRPSGQPNVQVAHIDLKNPFDVEEKPDPAVVQELINRYRHSVVDNPHLSLAQRSWYRERNDEAVKRLQQAKTNDDIYQAMSKHNWGDLTEVNHELADLGFDGIQYPGGKRVRGAIPHRAWVVFQQQPSIGPPRWPVIQPSPPPE